MLEYPREQLWKIYEQLPKELKRLVFSEETAENINTVCEANKIKGDEEISRIARLTGYVLLGLIPPDEFQKTLEQELKLKTEAARKISREIYRLIFYPAKESLSALYQMETESIEGLKREKPIEKETAKEEKKEKKKPKRKDTYREPFK